jgi:hypothetical protein
MRLLKLPEILSRTLIRIYQILVYLGCICLIAGCLIGCFIASYKVFGSGYWIGY